MVTTRSEGGLSLAEFLSASKGPNGSFSSNSLQTPALKEISTLMEGRSMAALHLPL